MWRTCGVFKFSRAHIQNLFTVVLNIIWQHIFVRIYFYWNFTKYSTCSETATVFLIRGHFSHSYFIGLYVFKLITYTNRNWCKQVWNNLSKQEWVNIQELLTRLWPAVCQRHWRLLQEEQRTQVKPIKGVKRASNMVGKACYVSNPIYFSLLNLFILREVILVFAIFSEWYILVHIRPETMFLPREVGRFSTTYYDSCQCEYLWPVFMLLTLISICFILVIHIFNFVNICLLCLCWLIFNTFMSLDLRNASY